MKVYFDSSALVKLLINEPGSSWAEGVWDDSAAPLTSSIAYVEVRAALASAHRTKRLSAKSLSSAKDRFELIWTQLGTIDCEPRLIRHAGEVAEVSALRGYDAIHITSALTLHASSPLYMLTWDDDLAEASFDAGINVIRTSDQRMD